MESTKPKGEKFIYIDLEAVNNKKNYIDNPKILKSINAPSRASRKLHTNDVLYSMVRPYLRNIALVDKKFSNAIASTGFYVITPSVALYPHFLFCLMLSSYVTDGLNLFMKGENSPSINNSHIEDFLYPLPPLNEQQRIVEKIEELTPHIEHYGKAQAELNTLNKNIKEQLKKSILQYAIEGKLVPQNEAEGTAEELLLQIQAEKQKLYEEGRLKKKDLEHSTVFKDEDNKYYEKIGKNITEIESDYSFPNSWAIARLSSICILTDGEKKEGQNICLDAKFLRGKTEGDYLQKGRFVQKGDNIILVDGENSGEVFTIPRNGYMGSTFKKLWVNPVMNLRYVLYFIQFYKDLLRNSKKGAAIPHLNKELFYSL
uniref:restriction endonuclease subunit S n=2 Tax=Capnocytophaga TaxID=1016 RepID=UPI00280BB23B